jgi:hypothetical protein
VVWHRHLDSDEDVNEVEDSADDQRWNRQYSQDEDVDEVGGEDDLVQMPMKSV